MTIATTTPIGELVTTPGVARVFEKFGIDYCCGGRRSLDEACSAAGVELSEVVRSLEEALPQGARTGGDVNYFASSVTDLVAHIVGSHHAFAKEEMLRLNLLFEKVTGVHGLRHPELRQLQRLFHQLVQDLSPHMMKEENVLFPYLVKLEESALTNTPLQRPRFTTVQNPIRMMLVEHEAVGEILREMRIVSSDYLAPVDACISYRTLYQTLQAFERDLHQHIHLENNVLFPRAADMETNQGGC